MVDSATVQLLDMIADMQEQINALHMEVALLLRYLQLNHA